MSLIEVIAATFGLICVCLYVRQNVWAWPTGLVQVALYLFVFYEAKLYSDLILHVVYVVLQLYGWYYWLHGGQERAELPVTRLSRRGVAAWVAVTVVGATSWGHAMASWTDAAVPYGDAFTTVASLVAQWLIARKKLETWLFWVAVDVVAIHIYLYKSLYVTAGLYAVFLGLAVAGFLAWRRPLAGRASA